MKTAITTLVFVSAALGASAPASAQLFGGKPKIEVTYVVMSKSDGLYAQDEKPLVDATFVFIAAREIAETERGRNQNRRIQINLTTEATNAVFSGTGDQLQRDGGRIFERISGFEQRCNDLTRSYANIARDIAIHGYESIRIIHIGPFVNVPAPCESAGSIHVPQTVSQEVELAAILSEAKRADFVALMVHPDQYAPLWDYLNAFGDAGMEDKSIQILRPDETRTWINYLDQGVAPVGGDDK
ncbi:MAG: hypothetical protein AAFP97_13435 [Pseudomonadota bacterium]